MKRYHTIIALAVLAPIISFGFGARPTMAVDASPAAGADYRPNIDPANFVPTIDNPYLPLKPGTVFVYDGTDEGEAEHNEVTVTDQTKTILGIPCVVVRDVVMVDGEITEDTHDWYAQDKDGNVWYMGEDSKSLENGKVTSSEGSWEAGVDGAEPGIAMPAHPEIGVEYRQEYYAGEAEDMASALSIGGSVTVPFGTFDNLLVTKEWSPLEPDVIEHKTYAPGVGLVLSESVQGEQERLELVDIRTGEAGTPIATPAA